MTTPASITYESAYRIAKIQFRESGRLLAKADLGGNLKVFPRVSFDSLF